MENEIDDPHAIHLSKKHEEKQVATKDTENSGSLAGPTSGENINSSNSDLSYHDASNDEEHAVGNNDNDKDVMGDDCNDEEDAMGDDFYDEEYAMGDDLDASDCDYDDDCSFDEGDDYDYSSKQAQFDNVDLPPGVEFSVNWFQTSSASSSKSNSSNVAAQVDVAAPSANAGTPASGFVHPANEKMESGGSSSSLVTAESSSSLVTAESSSHGKGEKESEDEVLRKYKAFNRFDTVEDFSEHRYKNMGKDGVQPSKPWTKKIQDEWRILEKDLPDTIFVRVYEARMDLLRAVLVGPQGTPYQDGLFVFDVYFPPAYPSVPPMVYYHSGGLRINPNLYECGKVCLSLLNTWSGDGNERWVPDRSTMLQVLVSIQALILNSEPFFNEPGHERSYTGSHGDKRSNEYNEKAFILSLKTMMYMLRRPPKHFEDLVAGHFLIYAHDILGACKAYMEGAPVGSVAKGNLNNTKVAQRKPSPTFIDSVSRMVNGLISNFSRYGVKDCEKFRISC